MPTVALDGGTLDYEIAGPDDGRPVVFIHGFLMGHSLWRQLSERLAARGLRCLAPTWPLGAHAAPVCNRAELTIEMVAGMVAGLLEELSLHDVVLVGNDTGGVIAQVAATRFPTRLGALVLTSCDAFERFPPPALKPLITAAKWPLAFKATLQPLRSRTVRGRGFGPLAHADIDHLVTEWVRPALTDARIREDLRLLTASLSQQTMADAVRRFPEFTKPALIAWSADDAFFPLEDGRRLAAELPDARLEIIDHSRTLSMIDRPDQLAESIAVFAGVGASRRAAQSRTGAAGPTAG
jgi:pimeloyl-ACP methyl ester carboxylesterase